MLHSNAFAALAGTSERGLAQKHGTSHKGLAADKQYCDPHLQTSSRYAVNKSMLSFAGPYV